VAALTVAADSDFGFQISVFKLMLFRACQFCYEFPRPALVMGIVNVTPDSFSDGGRFLDAGRAIEHALALMDQGADILDIGGESTRPGAEAVTEEEELRRVIPVIEALAARVRVPISIDTVKRSVARAALKAGASVVNDVAANRPDATMWQLVAGAGAGYVCMHMQGTPRTMQVAPRYGDVVREVAQFFGERLTAMATAGLAPEQVVLDPGIGFGKTQEHNLQLLANLGSFNQFLRPLMLGVSRKSFIGKIVEADVSRRLSGSLACACLAVQSGVHIIRTHDVAETVQAVRVTEAIVKNQV
jgi:dihydropteroate synthase